MSDILKKKYSTNAFSFLKNQLNITIIINRKGIIIKINRKLIVQEDNDFIAHKQRDTRTLKTLKHWDPAIILFPLTLKTNQREPGFVPLESVQVCFKIKDEIATLTPCDTNFGIKNRRQDQNSSL